MKLFLVHCGFYDEKIGDGLYESHMNFFVAANDFVEARAQVKKIPEFQKNKMHVDGMQVIEAVTGFKIELNYDPSLNDQSIIPIHKHREFAAKPAN